MADTFKTQIDEFIRKSNTMTTAVVQTAAQSMIEDAQTSRFKGGHMPIDTGFLVNSGKAQIGSVPSGESVRPDGFSGQDWSGAGEAAAVIANLKPGQILFFGWTAEYATYMENRYMFMRSAVQNWPLHVDDAVRELKQRLG